MNHLTRRCSQPLAVPSRVSVYENTSIAIRAFRQWRFQSEKADFTVKVPFKFEFLERPFTNTSHLTKRWSEPRAAARQVRSKNYEG